jgi:hypothetical protein
VITEIKWEGENTFLEIYLEIADLESPCKITISQMFLPNAGARPIENNPVLYNIIMGRSEAKGSSTT